jgi:hypothetical protein
MGLDHNLYIDTNMKESDVAELLVIHCGMHKDSTSFIRLYSEGIWSTFTPAEFSADTIEEDFGIQVKINFSSRIDMSSYDKGMKNLYQISATMLKNSDSDMVLLINGERTVFYRKQGNLFIDNHEDYWVNNLAPVFAEYGISFEFGKLPLHD